MLLLLIGGVAQATECALPDQPSVHVLTVAPGERLMDTFGHTALLLWDPALGERSPVYDYGRFRAESAGQVIHDVLFQEQTFHMEQDELGSVVQWYADMDRTVVAQELALTPAQQATVFRIVSSDLGDSRYPYHFRMDNCSTRVRDVIDRALGGTLQAGLAAGSDTSTANEVLRHLHDKPAVALALSQGMGAEARAPLSRWDGAFMPDGLRRELDAVYLSAETPLVARTCTLAERTRDRPPATPPDRTRTAAMASTMTAGLLGALGFSAPRHGRALAAAIGLVGGALGLVALILGLGGTFAPDWSLHNQWLVSPAWWLLPLAGVWQARKPASRGPLLLAAVPALFMGIGLVYAAVTGFADGQAALLAVVLPLLVAPLVGFWRRAP